LECGVAFKLLAVYLLYLLYLLYRRCSSSGRPADGGGALGGGALGGGALGGGAEEEVPRRRCSRCPMHCGDTL